MMNNNSFEIQNQIRQTALQNHENLKDLKTWETEMKDKEQKLLKQKEEQQSSAQNQVSCLFRNVSAMA